MKSLLFGLCLLVLVGTSCTRNNLSFLLQNIKENTPIQKVEYRIDRIKNDTLYVFHSPYKIFKGTYKQDSLGGYLKQEINWQELEEFLWQAYLKYKEKKANQKTEPTKSKRQ